jgi:hypothetical protein
MSNLSAVVRYAAAALLRDWSASLAKGYQVSIGRETELNPNLGILVVVNGKKNLQVKNDRGDELLL